MKMVNDDKHDGEEGERDKRDRELMCEDGRLDGEAEVTRLFCGRGGALF